MIHQRLQSTAEIEIVGDHPDEDTICAFIEGRLEETAASEMVSHLIVCGLCRRTTAQATRLDSQIIPEYDSREEEDGPSRLRTVLEDLAARVLPQSQEDVVFAYQNPPEQDNEVIESTLDEKKEPDSD
jgi:hypothetical protein